MAGEERAERLADSLLSSAEAAIEARNWHEALSFLEDVRVLDPHHAGVPALLQLVERHLGPVSVDAGRRFVTVMFADIADSTRLGDRLELESYAALMRLFEAEARPVVDSYRGHIYHYFGDGLVAYFGYPSAHEDDARRAVAAALDLLDAVRLVGPRATELYGAELGVRIGVYSGVVVVADRGSAGWTERSAAFGPVMNRAARLQSAAPPNGVVVSDSTLPLLNDEFEVESLGLTELKGIDEPIEIFLVTARREGAAGRLSSYVGPFVGRSEPMEHLRRRWREVVAGGPATGPRCLELVGEPGIGKSRLTREFLLEADGNTTSILQIQCNASASHIPLWPIRVLLAERVGLTSDDDAAARGAKLARLAERAGRDPELTVPVLASLLRVDPGPGYQPLELAPLQMREAVLSTVRDLVVSLSAQRPTIVVVEDAHWADELTVEVMRRLARAEAPIMVLAPTRRADAFRLEPSEVDTVILEPLSASQAAVLASALLPADTALDTIDRVARGSDGIPLYIEHVVRSLGDSDPAVPVPIGLEELLQARLDAVGVATRTANMASVVGREFELPMLEGVRARLDGTGMVTGVDLRRDLAALAVAGLIEVGTSPDSYRFRHALVESKAYESMLAPLRRAVHVAVAELLTEQIGAGIDVELGFVALHYERGDKPTEAVMSYLEAARVALQGGSFEATSSLLGCAFELLDRVGPELRSALELGLRLTRGYVISSTQGYAAEAAVEDYRVALGLCESLADQPWIGAEVVKALFGTWTFHAASGDLRSCAEAEQLLERQLATVIYPGGRPALDACRGVREFYLGHYATARQLLEAAFAGFADDDIDFTQWLVPNDPMVAAGAFLMLARFLDGDEAGAFTVRDEALKRAAALPFPQGPFSTAFLSTLEVWIHRYRGDQEAARATTAVLLGLGQRHGFVDWLIVGQMNDPATEAMVGPTAEQAAAMEGAITLWRSLGAVVLVNTLLSELAGLYLELGDVESARRCVDDALALGGQGQRVALPDAHVVEAHLAARAGDRDGAATCLDRALACAREQDSAFHTIRSGVAAAELLGPAALDAFAGPVRAALDRFAPDSDLPDVRRAREVY